MQSLTFIIFTVFEKFATLKILPHTDTRLAGRSSTDHDIDSHFSNESKSLHQKLFILRKNFGCVDSVYRVRSGDTDGGEKGGGGGGVLRTKGS